jgi:hypothetical protein
MTWKIKQKEKTVLRLDAFKSDLKGVSNFAKSDSFDMLNCDFEADVK